jgi:hypothetical protein
MLDGVSTARRAPVGEIRLFVVGIVSKTDQNTSKEPSEFELTAALSIYPEAPLRTVMGPSLSVWTRRD